MRVGIALSTACLFAGTWFSACSKSNMLLLGTVEATLGAHTVTVTDCYRLQVPPPQTITDPDGGPPTYRYTPCKDADVTIRAEELVVNDKSYGQLNPADSVTVDHGVVLINGTAARAMASN